MQVQRIQNNNYNANFGATINIVNRCGKMEKTVVEYLEKQFPQRTKNESGDMDVILSCGEGFPDFLSYNNGKGYQDAVELDIYTEQPKETLLEGLISSFEGFRIREKAQNRIDALKNEIVELSDKAYHESADKFKKVFSVWQASLVTHDIDKKGTFSKIIVYRNRSNKG